MTYTCKHCGEQVPALTICNCRGAQIEHHLEELTRHGFTGLKELETQNQHLQTQAQNVMAENLRLMGENAELKDDISAIRAAYTVQRNRASWHKERYENLEAEITRLTAEHSTLAVELAFANDAIKWQLEPKVAELTAALVECQEAFENGRDVGERSVGYGELEY